MHHRRNLFGCFAFVVVLICSAAANAEEIRTWQTPYSDYVADLPKQPSVVLQSLLDQNALSKQSDEDAAQYYSVLSMAYFALSYPAKALSSAQLALQTIDPEQQPWLFHITKLNEAQAYDIVGTPKDGLVGANAALIWGELNTDISMLVNALYVRGGLLNSMVDYQGALRDLQRAYELAPSSETLSRGDVAGMLALVYEYRREPRLAIPYFEEAAEFHRRNHNVMELSIALYGLGKANKGVGNLEIGRNQLIESKQLAEQVNDEQGVAYALKELAGISLSAKQFSLAQQQLEEALAIFKKSQNKFMLFDSYKTMLVVALEQKDRQAASEYLLLAKPFVDPQNMPLHHISLLELEARYLALNGQYNQAFNLLNSTVAMKQKGYSQSSTQQLHSLRSQYEIDIKERENRLLEQQNQLQQSDLIAVETKNLQLLLLFGATLVICALLILLVHRTVKNRTRFEKLANTDGLTGLANRRHALERIEEKISLSERHGLDMCIAIADIDLFKKINDTYGHAVGDKVLKQFGLLCQKSFRKTDVVGRIGGEEFVIALPLTALADAMNTLQSLSLNVKKLSDNIQKDGLTISISCGLTQYKKGTDLEQLLLECDEALYQAKRGGRDKVIIYDKSDPALNQLALP